MQTISEFIHKIRTVRRYQFISAAIIFHILVLVIFGPYYIVAPVTRDILFKSTFEEKKDPQEKPVIRPQEKPVVQEVPVKLTQKAPKPTKTVTIDPKIKKPTFVRPPKEVAPPRLEIPRREMAKTERIITHEMGLRRATYKTFSKQFKISGKGKQIEATITPYSASYQGGDWNCNPATIPNLMTEIGRRSNVKANVEPVVASVKGEELFKCPFVFFTGHNDFTFTDTEVTNLRKYLLTGGAIWADNALPGRRSRFDIAFRREMKRVLPDRDFETVPLSHPVFNSFYQIREISMGVSNRNEPLEMIMVDNRLVVLYTLNAYGDLMEAALTEDGLVDTALNDKWSYVYGPHWGRPDFENVNQDSIELAYQLAINIVVYFLQR